MFPARDRRRRRDQRYGTGAVEEYNRDRGAKGLGSTFHMTVTGERTGLTRDVNLYLPAQYYDPAYEHFTFPVIEWIPNFPSGPEVSAVVTSFRKPWTRPSKRSSSRRRWSSLRTPAGYPALGHDSECVDQVDGKAMTPT